MVLFKTVQNIHNGVYCFGTSIFMFINEIANKGAAREEPQKTRHRQNLLVFAKHGGIRAPRSRSTAGKY